MRSVYQVRIGLIGIEPSIWRQLWVPQDLTLAGLHHVLQIAMGWRDRAEHRFEIGQRRMGMGGHKIAWQVSDESGAVVSDLLSKRGPIVHYIYDFRCNWEHELLVEGIITSHEERPLPRCIGGERACPAEGCGGPTSYQALMAALAQRRSELHQIARQRLGARFDPAAFDAAQVNARFAAAVSPEWFETEIYEEGASTSTGWLFEYDAARDPDPEVWLGLDQGDRNLAIEEYHVRANLHRRSADLRAHAVLHMAAETHVAENDPPQARAALARLLKQGLDRHQAIHAIGTVLSEHLGRAVRQDYFDHVAYARDLENLSADIWRSEAGRSLIPGVMRKGPRARQAKIEARASARREQDKRRRAAAKQKQKPKPRSAPAGQRKSERQKTTRRAAKKGPGGTRRT
ncbi:MAG: plasmid pRiA4b ORF-3 family protein [Deltaproteobacteria bacterium]|nr:plasmid pRiA4b ORF-3 family protein [Deltaproteobacteria bacterium]